ncbi:MAG: hypothetical protein JRF35_14350 [Deltaproteobacteria bacterium]|nr:hypothetical protein [Deltaproteobacteria bacterium]
MIRRIHISGMTMNKQRSKRIDTHAPSRELIEGFGALLRWILSYANHGISRIDLLRELTKMLYDFSGCDSVELRIKHDDKYYRCEASQQAVPSISCEILSPRQDEHGNSIPSSQDHSGLELLCKAIIRGVDPSSPFVNKNGSFCTGDTKKPFTLSLEAEGQGLAHSFCIGGEHSSLALIPFVVNDENTGLLQLKSKQRNYFTEDEIEFYETIAQTLGVAMANWHAHAALRERVKELTCLYDIAQVVYRPGISLEEMLQDIVELLPPAWQYPESASARIMFDGRSYITPGFREGKKLTADIIVNGERRGFVGVFYAENKLELDEDLFLKEERSLINAVARQIALIIERRQAEEDKAKLQDQLRHADRLATIGQLAAGVAHELNEPLGNILGFAQLANKCPALPEQAGQDIYKIITASLHAREIIKKLMLFARQMPPDKTRVNLNQVIENALYLFQARYARRRIELVHSLSPDLPEVFGDPTQLNQVLINLAINSLQAMPEGGKLTVSTYAQKGCVSLVVEDTGIGMSDEVMKQIFVPFFTTKDVDKGTGLGLPVVHGIVTSHGGSINVKSEVGVGTRVEIQLPVAGLNDIEERCKDDTIG